jgi:hypothetical protein
LTGQGVNHWTLAIPFLRNDRAMPSRPLNRARLLECQVRSNCRHCTTA